MKKMDFCASLMIVILVFSVTGCGKENKVNKVNSKVMKEMTIR